MLPSLTKCHVGALYGSSRVKASGAEHAPHDVAEGDELKAIAPISISFGSSPKYELPPTVKHAFRVKFTLDNGIDSLKRLRSTPRPYVDLNDATDQGVTDGVDAFREVMYHFAHNFCMPPDGKGGAGLLWKALSIDNVPPQTYFEDTIRVIEHPLRWGMDKSTQQPLAGTFNTILSTRGVPAQFWLRKLRTGYELDENVKYSVTVHIPMDLLMGRGDGKFTEDEFAEEAFTPALNGMCTRLHEYFVGTKCPQGLISTKYGPSQYSKGKEQSFAGRTADRTADSILDPNAKEFQLRLFAVQQKAKGIGLSTNGFLGRPSSSIESFQKCIERGYTGTTESQLDLQTALVIVKTPTAASAGDKRKVNILG